MIYPWLEDRWQQLIEQVDAGILPHALLITGSAGLGKLSLAKALGIYLQCHQPVDKQACGSCKSCLLHQVGTHPDYKVLTLEEGSRQIKIDAVRQVSDFVLKKSQQGGYKIVIIDPAVAMNENASNALLKSLEEPGESTVIILLGVSSQQVLPTIRSRCQLLQIRDISFEQGEQWLAPQVGGLERAKYLLAVAKGQPTLALELDQSPKLQLREQILAELTQLLEGQTDLVVVAQKWAKAELGEVVGWLLDWYIDLAKWTATGGYTAMADCQVLYRLLALRLNPQKLHQQVDKLTKLKAVITKGASPNKQLLLEGVLADLSH
ncbi:DNA polymerase III subunit delta' [Sinobacterium norvegicum]|uniref:DNA polymerase III subunit delta' n=1 Tax=Sinobacterium norvegicum TaxID=1641715 RepID=A0ABM9ABZ8_9GAMM|nr:DNA polymerase III subunit delta' [Sinobacterium norvegicum]CAH0990129.1 DNA polymerase III subunit delta' [Sinobacterium norvegicum]